MGQVRSVRGEPEPGINESLLKEQPPCGEQLPNGSGAITLQAFSAVKATLCLAGKSGGIVNLACWQGKPKLLPFHQHGTLGAEGFLLLESLFRCKMVTECLIVGGISNLRR